MPNSRIKEIVDRVVNELGVPETEKQIEDMAKRLKVELELLKND